MNRNQMKTVVIIVTFNPVVSKLLNLIDELRHCCCIPVVIDNSENVEAGYLKFEHDVVYKALGSNKGIAFAQNEGLKIALDMNADVVGFFDQDSTISTELISRLINAASTYEGCVVAPVALNVDTKEEYPSQILTKIGRGKDVYAKGSECPIKVDVVISSGSFMSSDIIKEVGFFDSELFIDFVDIDWCLRCRKKGISILVIPDAILEHAIGEKNRKIMGLTVTQHSPYRTYYKVRNPFLMLRKKYSIIFSLNQVLTALVHNFLLVLVDGKYSFYYFKGLKDGILGRGGEIRYGKNKNRK